MITPQRVRLEAARVCAWLLWLSGWIGLATLVQIHASGTAAGFSLLALWVLATGANAEVVRRLRLAPGAARVVLAAVALVTAWLAYTPRGGDATLVALLLGWSATLALASAAVRACRPGAGVARDAATIGRPPGPPIASGAAAAALAWLILGDLTYTAALHARLAGVVLVAAIVLVLLWPREAGMKSEARSARRTVGCRAALFDCALPAWPAADASDRLQRWPLMLSALVMLPMMCGLPLMLSLCRGAAIGPHEALGLHLAAMFVPALFFAGRRPWAIGHVATVCATLLLGGAVVATVVGGSGGDWTLAIAQGAAWSLAWAARLNGRVPREKQARGEVGASAAGAFDFASLRAPLAGAALNAMLIVALGWALERYGLAALRGGQVALGALAAVWLVRNVLQTTPRSEDLRIADIFDGQLLGAHDVSDRRKRF